jgi:hypothetical protein
MTYHRPSPFGYLYNLQEENFVQRMWDKVWCYLGTHWELGSIQNNFWELSEKCWNHVEHNWEHQILKKSHIPPWCVGHHIWPRLMAGAQTVGRCSRSQILTWGSEVGSNSWIAEPYTHGCCVPGLCGGIVSLKLLLTECRLNMSWVRMTSIQARIQCHTIQNKP